MRVANRDGQRIGGIWPGDLHARQMQPDHMVNLHLGRMADADMSAGLQPSASLAPYVEGARFDDVLTALA